MLPSSRRARLRQPVLGSALLLALVLAVPTALAAPVGDLPEMDQTRASDLSVERPSNFAIPNAPDRPTLPTAGPFFDVKDVKIEGIQDRPDIGLSVDSLLNTARDELKRQAHEQEIETQGYSNEELLQVARYLDEVKNRRDDTDFTKVALLNQLIDLLKTFQSRRGISVFDLEAVASAVQDKVRDTGLILAQVVVPPQTVKDGVVTLQVYPGRLGGVELVNNRVYQQQTFEKAFAKEIGEPVLLSQIDERLRIVNDFNGLDVSGVFVPGRVPGETLLQLNAVNERRWSVTERVDNHGAASTGRTRALFALSIYDPTGAGDELTGTVIRSEGPDPATIGSLNYYRPIDDIRSFVQAGYTRSEFAIGGATDVRGDTRNYDLALGTHWIRRRDRNLNQTVQISYKDSNIVIAGGALDRSQKVAEFGSTLTYDALITGWRAVVDGSTSLKFGSITEGRFRGDPNPANNSAFPGQEENFVILSQTLRFYKLFDLPLPFVEGYSHHSLLLRINAQYSEQQLPGVEKFALGGADGVRSLLADDISVDNGVVANFNFYWKIPESLDFTLPYFTDEKFSEAVRPYIFYDYGYGVTKASRQNAAQQDDTWFAFTGYGAGFEYNLQKNNRGGYAIHGSIVWARPSSSRFGNPGFENVIDDEDRIYADLTLDVDQNDFPWFGGKR